MIPPSRDDRRHYKNNGQPKVTFKTEAEAVTALEGAPPTVAESIQAYRCPCGEWHHGNRSWKPPEKSWLDRERAVHEMTCELGIRVTSSLAIENEGSEGTRRRAIRRRWQIGLNLPHEGEPRWRTKTRRKNMPLPGSEPRLSRADARAVFVFEEELGQRATSNMHAENQGSPLKRLNVLERRTKAAMSKSSRLGIPTPLGKRH